MSINGEKYRHCLAWRAVAGNGHACFDMCSKPQREACEDQQMADGKRCRGCERVQLTNPVVATFKKVFSDSFCCTEVDVEFCSEECAAAYGAGKERLK